MSIVLNDRRYAEQALQFGRLDKKSSETLSRVARYYIDSVEGISNAELTKRLENFILQCNPNTPIPKWDKTIAFSISWARKHPAINIDAIVITKPEMDTIDGLKSRQLKRLAFTLLCLSKYWDEVNTRNCHWVNMEGSEIASLANIQSPVKRQCSLYSSLEELGLIHFSKKVSNTNICVCFAQDGDEEMRITDFRNLGWQYHKHYDETHTRYHEICFFECECCGIVVKENNPRKGRKQRYCDECAAVTYKQRDDIKRFS